MPDARNFGRHNGHHHSGNERKPSASDIAADGIDRAHHLTDFHTRFDFHRPWLRQLFFRDAADVANGVFQRAKKIAAHFVAGGTNFALGDPQTFAVEIDAVEFLHPSGECRVSAPPNIADNLRRDAFSFCVMLLARTQKFLLDRRRKFHDAHQSTILFKGYSTIPWAFAALSFGRICRTTASSTIVLIATQSGSLKAESGGFFHAGRTPRTACSSSRWTFRSRPTLLAAAIAPCSIRIRFSAFSRFQESAAAARFMMNTVADSSTVSTMRRRFARSGEPVSVPSTIASASCGTLTSVAPHENSTRAFTPCLAR